VSALPSAARHVPLRAALALMNRGTTHFACFIVFLAVFLTLIVVGLQDTESQHFRDDFPRVTASVTEVTFAPASKRSKQWYTYHYRYQVNGRAYQGSVYHPALVTSKELSVQYVPGNPAMARVDGMGNPGMARWALSIPAAVFGYALYLFWRAWAATRIELRMMREGRLATATVRRVKQQAIVDFCTDSGEQWHYQPAGNTRELKQGSSTQVLYVPGHPADTELVARLKPAIRALLH
jgi:hypothetical protein